METLRKLFRRKTATQKLLKVLKRLVYNLGTKKTASQTRKIGYKHQQEHFLLTEIKNK